MQINNPLMNTKVSFCNGKERIGYDVFIQDVGRFANYFSNNIKNDTVILYITNNFYLFCVCFFGLLYAHKSVALPGLLTIQNASGYRDLTNIIVTDSNDDYGGFTKILPHVPDGSVTWDFTDISKESVYFFTSGSTGTPKRIKKTISMLIAEVEYHIQFHKDKIAELPVVVASIAPYHMYGVLWRVLFSIVGGLVVDTDMVFTPEELIKKQSIYEKILFMTTPSFLDGITKYGGQYNFSNNCIGIFTSGSLLQSNTSESARTMFGVSPFEIFGSTETGGIAFRQQEYSQDWTVFDGVNVSIINGCLSINSKYSFQNPYLTSDAVEMIDNNHFKLLGRADRVVKIAEERISLLDMETWLGKHPFISRAYCTAMHKGARDIIACAIELTDNGAQCVIDVRRRAFINKIKKYLSGFVPNVALPRCVRIMNHIPTNAQGKFVKTDILAMLNSSVVEPIVQNVTRTETTIEADLTFLGDSAYFNGHFPKIPILPGVIQMHFVFMFIRQFFRVNASAFDIVKLKYSALILPDITTHFELARLNESEFTFCYSQKEKVCSAGKIVIRGGGNV